MIISVCCIRLGATPLQKNNAGDAPLKGTIISFYGGVGPRVNNDSEKQINWYWR